MKNVLTFTKNGVEFTVWEEPTCWVIQSPNGIFDVSTFDDLIESIDFILENG